MLVWSIWKIFIIRIYNIYILITFIFFQLHTNTMGYYMISGQTKNERYHIIDQVSVNTKLEILIFQRLSWSSLHHTICCAIRWLMYLFFWDVSYISKNQLSYSCINQLLSGNTGGKSLDPTYLPTIQHIPSQYSPFVSHYLFKEYNLILTWVSATPN